MTKTLSARKGFIINLIILDGNDLTLSDKARAHGVTTKVRTVATVKPTTSEAAICSQKLVIYEPVLIDLSMRSIL